MSRQTFPLGAATTIQSGAITWQLTTPLPAFIAALVDGGAARHLFRILVDRAFNPGSVFLDVSASASDLSFGSGQDLSALFETQGELTLALSNGMSVTFPAPNNPESTTQDAGERYFWTPGATDLWDAIVDAVNADGTLTADLTFDDTPLPDAAAPTVTVDAIADIDEGDAVTLNATVADGTYDTLTYAWTLAGVEIATGNNQSYTPVDVSSDTLRNITCTVTASGDGTTAADGTSDTATDDESFTVRDVPDLVLSDWVAPAGQVDVFAGLLILGASGEDRYRPSSSIGSLVDGDLEMAADIDINRIRARSGPRIQFNRSGSGNVRAALETGGALNDATLYVQDVDGVASVAIADLASTDLGNNGFSIRQALDAALYGKINDAASGDRIILSLTQPEVLDPLEATATLAGGLTGAIEATARLDPPRGSATLAGGLTGTLAGLARLGSLTPPPAALEAAGTLAGGLTGALSGTGSLTQAPALDPLEASGTLAGGLAGAISGSARTQDSVQRVVQPRSITALDIWTDVAANGGELVASFVSVYAGVDDDHLSGVETASWAVTRRATAWDHVREGYIARPVWADPTWAVREWRITSLEDGWNGGVLFGHLEAEGIRYDLGTRAGLVTNAAGATDFDLPALSPSAAMDLVMDQATLPGYVVRGLVETGADVDIRVEAFSPLRFLMRVAADSGLELDIRRTPAGTYAIDLVERRGPLDDNEVTFAVNRNVTELRHRTHVIGQATRLYGRGGGPDGEKLTIAGNAWGVESVSGKVLTLDPGVATPIGWDDQLTGPNMLLTDCEAEQSGTAARSYDGFNAMPIGDIGLAVGETISFGGECRIDGAGTSSLRVRFLGAGGSIIETRVTPTVVTSGYKRRVLEDLTIPAGTETIRLQGYGTGTGIRRWRRVFLNKGSRALVSQAARNTTLFARKPDGSTTEILATDRGDNTVTVRDAAGIGAGSSVTFVADAGGSPLAFLDRPDEFAQHGAIGGVYDRSDIDPSKIVGNAANVLWQAINGELRHTGAPRQEFALRVADLHRVDPVAEPDAEIVVGGFCRIVDTTLGKDFRHRIVGRKRDQVTPGKSEIILSSDPTVISGRLGRNSRVPFVQPVAVPDVDAGDVLYGDGSTVESLKPAEAGADETSGHTAADTAAVGGRSAADVDAATGRALSAIENTGNLSRNVYRYDGTNTLVLTSGKQGGFSRDGDVVTFDPPFEDAPTVWFRPVGLYWRESFIDGPYLRGWADDEVEARYTAPFNFDRTDDTSQVLGRTPPVGRVVVSGMLYDSSPDGSNDIPVTVVVTAGAVARTMAYRSSHADWARPFVLILDGAFTAATIVQVQLTVPMDTVTPCSYRMVLNDIELPGAAGPQDLWQSVAPDDLSPSGFRLRAKIAERSITTAAASVAFTQPVPGAIRDVGDTHEVELTAAGYDGRYALTFSGTADLTLFGNPALMRWAVDSREGATGAWVERAELSFSAETFAQQIEFVDTALGAGDFVRLRLKFYSPQGFTPPVGTPSNRVDVNASTLAYSTRTGTFTESSQTPLSADRIPWLANTGG